MGKYLWLIGLFLFTGVLHAQGCPEGYEPIVGQGFTGCAPRPDNDSYNQPQQPQQQASQSSPEQWADHYGAIATDEPRGALGTATDMLTQEKAKAVAIANCKAHGGVSCTLQTWYRNECTAMVVGGKIFNVNLGATADEATTRGMQMCKTAASDCHVYYSACSLPERIQ